MTKDDSLNFLSAPARRRWLRSDTAREELVPGYPLPNLRWQSLDHRNPVRQHRRCDSTVDARSRSVSGSICRYKALRRSVASERIVGDSPALRTAVGRAQRAAIHEVPVLILGERYRQGDVLPMRSTKRADADPRRCTRSIAPPSRGN